MPWPRARAMVQSKSVPPAVDGPAAAAATGAAPLELPTTSWAFAMCGSSDGRAPEPGVRVSPLVPPRYEVVGLASRRLLPTSHAADE
eukprot:NODE_23151_length_678_cov_3.145191.p5 GENE.NODE_23151_length_678_cov_3.145191~~NODE_23151_length_678_cov_3.145191.p5  ORF type:complete len:87 (-),score=18.57 NODE_23151_length_678_cov_3.145191:44-304(-)